MHGIVDCFWPVYFKVMAEELWFVGVDVGTESVRAGLFSASGTLQTLSKKKIRTWENEQFREGSYEQSTADIWSAVCTTVRVSSTPGPSLVNFWESKDTCVE